MNDAILATIASALTRQQRSFLTGETEDWTNATKATVRTNLIKKGLVDHAHQLTPTANNLLAWIERQDQPPGETGMPLPLMFSLRVKWARRKAGLSQAELGRRAGYGAPHIRAIERQANHLGYNTTIQTVDNIATALRVSPAWLLGFDPADEAMAAKLEMTDAD